MTQDQKIAYAESALFRAQCKGNFLKYADEQIRNESAQQYTLIPDQPTLSKQYDDARVRVSQDCLRSPDQFTVSNSASVAQMLPDPLTADDLAILGAVINLWESLAGGKPVPAPLPPAGAPAGAPTGRAA